METWLRKKRHASSPAKYVTGFRKGADVDGRTDQHGCRPTGEQNKKINKMIFYRFSHTYSRNVCIIKIINLCVRILMAQQTR